MGRHFHPENYNVDLMLEVRAAIQMEPERHNQLYWSSDEGSICGTSMCIAGWTAAVCGMTVNAATHAWREEHPPVRNTAYVDPIAGFAAEKLGLQPNSYEMDRLFYCMDNEVALSRLDEYIAAGKDAQ